MIKSLLFCCVFTTCLFNAEIASHDRTKPLLLNGSEIERVVEHVVKDHEIGELERRTDCSSGLIQLFLLMVNVLRGRYSNIVICYRYQDPKTREFYDRYAIPIFAWWYCEPKEGCKFFPDDSMRITDIIDFFKENIFAPECVEFQGPPRGFLIFGLNGDGNYGQRTIMPPPSKRLGHASFGRNITFGLRNKMYKSSEKSHMKTLKDLFSDNSFCFEMWQSYFPDPRASISRSLGKEAFPSLADVKKGKVVDEKYTSGHKYHIIAFDAYLADGLVTSDEEDSRGRIISEIEMLNAEMGGGGNLECRTLSELREIRDALLRRSKK